MATEDPDLEHETSWEPGVSALMQMVYRPICSCGWKGGWLRSQEFAEAEAKAHVESMPRRTANA